MRLCSRVACISCPTLYQKLRVLKPSGVSAVLLEFDSRFEKYGADFIHYDYNNPLELPANFEKAFDLVIIDPPFLSDECLQKTAQTVRFLVKDKIILCTGMYVLSRVLTLLALHVMAAQNLAHNVPV